MVLGLVAGLRSIGTGEDRSRRAMLNAVGLLAAAADAAVASTSRPFTWPANVTTGLGLVVVVLAGLARLRLPQPTRTLATAVEAPSVGPDRGSHAGRRTVVLWVTMTLAVTAFELVNYVSSPRDAHPTLSSLLNVLTGHEVLRGLLFTAWLAAGWWMWGRP